MYIYICIYIYLASKSFSRFADNRSLFSSDLLAFLAVQWTFINCT